MPQPAKTTIVMIDDQVSYADAFGLALSLTTDLELVGHASDAKAGFELVLAQEPGLVLCDYRLPDGETGTLVARHLREHGFVRPIIVLTGFPAPQVRREASQLDSVHVLSKDQAVNEILAYVRAVISGEVGTGAQPDAADTIGLSQGELEVLELLNQGYSPTDAANHLYLSLHAIRSRIKSIHKKLEVTSQPEAISVATRLGLLVPPK